jgi:hypothetical protein
MWNYLLFQGLLTQLDFFAILGNRLVTYYFYTRGHIIMQINLKKLLLIWGIVTLPLFAKPQAIENFVQAVGCYDKVVRVIDIPDKTYEELPAILGKVLGISLWIYGVYRGLRDGDMGKIAMATVAGLSFGASVAVASKIVLESTCFLKWLYRLHRQELIIRNLAHELKLQVSDIMSLDTGGYTEQTRTMLFELQLELPR